MRIRTYIYTSSSTKMSEKLTLHRLVCASQIPLPLPLLISPSHGRRLFTAAMTAVALRSPAVNRAASPDTSPPATAGSRRPTSRSKVRGQLPPSGRRRKDRLSPGAGRRGGPAISFLRWKFDDGVSAVDWLKKPPTPRAESGGRSRRRGGGDDGSVSARKLAAALWHLELHDVGIGMESGRRTADRHGEELAHGHLSLHVSNPNSALQSPVPVSNMKNNALYKVEPRISCPDSAMEKATKWDPGSSKTPDRIYQIYDQWKVFDDQQIGSVSLVPTLQAELEHARACILHLETERRNAKKKLDHFLKKVAEENAAWRSREHEKVRAIIEDVKDDLTRERKNRQRLEIVNAKLVNELAEAKMTTKRLLQDYEKERKARELIEEVCDELAKEIAEDKAELEALKKESMRVREEVEEEKKMLQMAEVWREERVQLKLVDAKVALEEKFSQMSKLIVDIEEFLRSRTMAIDVVDVKEAELLKKAADSVQIQDIKEFSYQPPTSNDFFAVFEELRSAEANVEDHDASLAESPASHISKVHTVNPEMNGFNKRTTQKQPDGFTNACEDADEDGSGWETVSQLDEQGSSNSAEISFPSINGHREESVASGSGTEWDDNGDNETIVTETSEAYSASMKQGRKKASAICKLWRSSTHNGENCKKTSVEMTNGRHSTGRVSNGFAAYDGRSGEMGISPASVGHWSSPDSTSGNPRLTKGMKGCMDWPRGMQKHSLKSKHFEARMDTQKVQLRQVLKHKI